MSFTFPAHAECAFCKYISGQAPWEPIARTGTGVAQVFALLAGISRSGITMVVGLVRGLDHEDAARFSFMLATPITLAAGVYKLPASLGPTATV